jgi:hypothetical protein
LEEKTEANFQLAMETAHFAQSVSDRLLVVERDVAEIKGDMAELKATQLCIEQRMQIFDERLAAQQSRIDGIAPTLLNIESRLRRVEDAVFPL